MKDKYNPDIAWVYSSDLEPALIMQKNPLESIKSIIRRMNLECEDGLPKEVYVTVFKEQFCSDSKWIIQMLPGDMLDLLMEIWESDQIEMDQERWDMVQYLKIFGLVTYRRGNPITGEPNELHYIEEMKDTFYFLLKSKKSRTIIKEYGEWEKIISGLFYYYGLIEIPVLHQRFTKIIKQVIPYELFQSFIKSRCSFWGMGMILQDVNKETEYFQHVNVENAELTLLYIREHPDLPYKVPEKEDLIYISEAGGLDNRWKGIGELGKILLDDMKMDYYQATVMVKMLVVLIQNSCEWKELQGKLSTLPFRSEEMKNEAVEAVTILYDKVPIFEYKGFSRQEFNKMFHQKQLKKKKEMFTIIEGGK